MRKSLQKNKIKSISKNQYNNYNPTLDWQCSVVCKHLKSDTKVWSEMNIYCAGKTHLRKALKIKMKTHSHGNRYHQYHCQWVCYVCVRLLQHIMYKHGNVQRIQHAMFFSVSSDDRKHISWVAHYTFNLKTFHHKHTLTCDTTVDKVLWCRRISSHRHTFHTNTHVLRMAINEIHSMH